MTQPPVGYWIYVSICAVTEIIGNIESDNPQRRSGRMG
jgi:hypothetical protein